MTAHRPFLELHPDDPDALARLASLADLTAADMGAVRAQFRPWPGTTAWVVTAVAAVAGVAGALAAPDDAGRLVGLAVVGTFLLFVGLFVATGAVDRIRVCEHGLVLGWRTRSRYVVPWRTVDPGRVRVVHRVGLVGRLSDATPSSPHYRLGILTTRALAVNGLDTAIGGWLRVPGLLDVTDRHDVDSEVRVTPFAWWLLGTRRPADLARAIEDAMVADGYDAAGLADRALAAAHTMRLNPGVHHPFPARRAADPVVGIRGPHLP